MMEMNGWLLSYGVLRVRNLLITTISIPIDYICPIYIYIPHNY